MGHIKEPKGVDFFIQSDPLTIKEKKEISEFIKKRKQLISKKNTHKKIDKAKISATNNNLK